MKTVNATSRWYRTTSIAACAALLLLPVGCASRPQAPERTPTVSVLRITQHVGGTHYRTLVTDRAWFQTFGGDLLVLEPRSMRVLHRLEVGRIGESGPIVDLHIHDGRLYAVLRDEAVVEIELQEGRHPTERRRVSADELGVSPRRLGAVEGELYVSGDGGIVRYSDGRHVFRHGGDTGRPVMSREGMVACAGRHIHRIDDGGYAGAATELHPLDIAGARDGTIFFVRQAAPGALVGLLAPDLIELELPRATIALPGTVRSVRVFDGLIWVVTDDEVAAFAVDEHGLSDAIRLDVLGVRDVGRLDDAHVALAGTFGRTMYRHRVSGRGPAEEFLFTHREASRLTSVRSDGRHILAGSREGAWLYRIGNRVEFSTLPLGDAAADGLLEPVTEAEVGGVRATISDAGRALLITTIEGTFEHIESDGERLHTVVIVDDDLWIGRDGGISVLSLRRVGPDGRPHLHGRFTLDGPVRHLVPLRSDRGVGYVAEFGGFGVLRFVEEPVTTAP
jgi:hypothetical protein